MGLCLSAPSSVGSEGEDRVDKQISSASRLLIFHGKQIIRGIGQLLNFFVMGREAKPNFEMSVSKAWC